MTKWRFNLSELLSCIRIRRALALVWLSARNWTAAGALLMLFQGILPVAVLYLTKSVIDAVAGREHVPFSRIALLIGVTVLVSLILLAVRLLNEWIQAVGAQRVTDHVQNTIQRKSVQVDLEYYDNAAYYDTLHRAQEEAPDRPANVVNDLVRIAQGGISLLAMAGLLLSFHPGLVFILMLSIAPGLVVRLQHANRMHDWHRERAPRARVAWYLNYILTGGTHAKEIRMFGLGDLLIQRFCRIRDRLRSEKLALAGRRALSEFLARSGSTAALFIAFILIAFHAYQGAITVGALVICFQAFQRATGHLREILGAIAALYEDNLFLTAYYDFLDLEPKMALPRRPRPVPRPVRQGILFENVSFCYPDADRRVLSHVNLQIRPGEHVAVVGENGAGKTTLIKLLCRLYDPSSGRITLDGIDLREFRPEEWRREISVIFQDYVRYNLPVRDNIWFGNIGLPYDHDDIVTAAERSGADKFINRMPLGYDTILGKMLQDGEELSIGEWQKVALARAFLRRAQIYALDEPTSVLDSAGEDKFYSNFHGLARGKTALLISHRFSTVRMADRIFVLEDGHVIESGTHEQLLENRGCYGRLYRMQAQNYS